MQNVQSLKTLSLDNIVAVQSVNNSKSAGKSGDFQQYMDNTGKTAQAVEPARQVTDTKVSVDSKPMDNVGQEAYPTSSGQTQPGGDTVSEVDTAVAIQAVKDAVQSVLHIDDETLETVMSEMGISLLQLLDPAVLQEFVVNLNPGADVTDFLTSEAMLGDFTDVMEALDDIDWEGLVGMSKEEFAQVLDSVPEQNMSEGVLELTDMPEDEGIIVPEQGEEIVQKGTEPEKFTVAAQDASLKGHKTSENTKATDVQGNISQDGNQAVAATEEAGEDAPQSQFSQQNSRSPLQDTRSAANQPVTVMEFVENMMQATDKVQMADAVKMQQMIDIVNQVVENIRSSVQEDTTTMEMQLNPESLGKVLLSVSNRQGVMTAHFTVQTQEAKEALESQIINLRETLEQKNLKVESVEVNVSDFAFDQSAQADTSDQKDFNQGHGKRMRFQFDDEDVQDEISVQAEAEQVRRSVMRDNGSSIDYTA